MVHSTCPVCQTDRLNHNWLQTDRPKARIGLVDLLDTLLISYLLMQHMIFFAYFLFMRLFCQFFTYFSATRRCAHELSLFLPLRINYIGSSFLACVFCCHVLTACFLSPSCIVSSIQLLSRRCKQMGVRNPTLT